jgi:hypothetical protein
MFKTLQKLFAGVGTVPEQISTTNIRCSKAIFQYYPGGRDRVYIGDANVTTKMAIIFIGPGKVGDIMDSILIEPSGVGNNVDLSHIYMLATHDEGVNVYYEEF